MLKSKTISLYLAAYLTVFSDYKVEDKDHVVTLAPGWCWVDIESRTARHEIRGRYPSSVIRAMQHAEPCTCCLDCIKATKVTVPHLLRAEFGYLPDVETLVMLDKYLEQVQKGKKS